MIGKKKTIGADGICAIIEACAKAGVTTFKHGPIQINFAPKSEEIVVPAESFDQELRQRMQDFGLTVPETPEIETPPVATAEEELIEDANLMFEDPVAWELEQMKNEGN